MSATEIRKRHTGGPGQAESSSSSSSTSWPPPPHLSLSSLSSRQDDATDVDRDRPVKGSTENDPKPTLATGNGGANEKKGKEVKEEEAVASVADSSDASDDRRPSTIKVWLLASRPHTLTASILPVIVGAALARRRHLRHDDDDDDDDEETEAMIRTTSALFASFACLVQIATNLHNDYADYVRGADTPSRLGQARATQKGWLTPAQTASGSTVCLVSALFVGAYLTFVSGWAMGETTATATATAAWAFDGTFAAIVLSSCFNAVAYTGGPYPLGYVGLGNVSIAYSGLGDLFAFLYFGLVATMSVPYLCLRFQGNRDSIWTLLLGTKENGNGANDYDDGGNASPPPLLVPFLAALPVGFLATAIIVVNNLRDRTTDLGANKRTMAVRFGETFTRMEYAALVLGSYASLAVLALQVDDDNNGGGGNAMSMIIRFSLPILSFPVAMTQLKAVALGEKDGADLNEHVGGTAKLQLYFCLLLSMSLRRRS